MRVINCGFHWKRLITSTFKPHYNERGTRWSVMNATLEQELCLWCENVSRCFDSDDRNLTYASAPSRSPTCMCTCTCLYSALPLRHAASLCPHIDKRGEAMPSRINKNDYVGWTYFPAWRWSLSLFYEAKSIRWPGHFELFLKVPETHSSGGQVMLVCSGLLGLEERSSQLFWNVSHAAVPFSWAVLKSPKNQRALPSTPHRFWISLIEISSFLYSNKIKLSTFPSQWS